MAVNYVPSTLDEALLLRKDRKAIPLAGGTDIMVQGKRGLGLTPQPERPVMIISHLKDELGGIRKDEDGSVVIGALATAAEIASSDLVPWHVRTAASGMGAIALRNSATIGGNIGNASPKGDLPQPLILLDAEVVLISFDGERRMLLDDFIQGSKKTDLHDDEIIASVVIPPHDFTYSKDGLVVDFRASSGAAGPKVIRSREAESMIIRRPVEDIEGIVPDFLEAWDHAISPHAMPRYRRNTTSRMLTRFLEAIVNGEPEGIVR